MSNCADVRVRWFDLPKAPGIGYANRNVALREARGRYIAYLAHDDLWLPDHLELLGRAFDRGAAFVHARALEVSLHGRMLPYWCNLEVPAHRAAFARGRSAFPMSAVAHTRDCLTKYGYWNDALLRGGDLETWHRIASRDAVAFVPDATSIHFVANWRVTPRYRAQTTVAGWILNGHLDRLVPAALHAATAAAIQRVCEWLPLDARDKRAGLKRLRGMLQRAPEFRAEEVILE